MCKLVLASHYWAIRPWCLGFPGTPGCQCLTARGVGLSILQITHVKQKTKGAVSCQWMHNNERGHTSCQHTVSNYCTVSPPGLWVHESSMRAAALLPHAFGLYIRTAWGFCWDAAQGLAKQMLRLAKGCCRGLFSMCSWALGRRG